MATVKTLLCLDLIALRREGTDCPFAIVQEWPGPLLPEDKELMIDWQQEEDQLEFKTLPVSTEEKEGGQFFVSIDCEPLDETIKRIQKYGVQEFYELMRKRGWVAPDEI